MKTTLNKIKDHSPCRSGWLKLLNFLNKTEADDEELPLLTILKSNGISDTLFALRGVDGFDKEKRLMACDFAESVVDLMKDERSINAIKVARNYANGVASIEELRNAWFAAYDATGAARAAAEADSTDATWDAYWLAARVASSAAARAAAAAWATVRFADASADAAADAAYEAACAAKDAAFSAARCSVWDDDYAKIVELKKQIKIFKKYVK